ncbi:MAG: hypothetical protein U1F61_08910 [Opitutaceae bacterium]
MWHEVAHALDATKQPVERTAPASPMAPGQLFKVRHVAAFFVDVVLSEIAACRLAALACNQAMLDLEMDSDRASLNRMLAALKEHTLAHRGDYDDLWRIAFEAAQCFWLPFVQYGKTIAHIAGNSELRQALILWADCPPEVEGILKDYVALLNDTFPLYPAVPADFPGRLTALWIRMAAAYGFRFPEAASGDGVYWKWRTPPATGSKPEQ